MPMAFQPNPLTQKDWNKKQVFCWSNVWFLPTKSIDPEGLKHHGNDLLGRIHLLPTKSIDPEGLKPKIMNLTRKDDHPSNQIHWPRRIETALPDLGSTKIHCFQPNPLTQKDWNRKKVAQGLPDQTLPTKSIDPEGLKQKANFLEVGKIYSSNQIHWPRRIETDPKSLVYGTCKIFQPNPLTQKDWNNILPLVLLSLMQYFQPNPLTQKDWNIRCIFIAPQP